MKTFYAINGSPRQNWNTGQLLEAALKGLKAAYPEEEIHTEIVNLYKITYTGCRSCFACKRKGGPFYGKCAVGDELQQVLEKVLSSQGVIMGSPIYFANITGQLHSFLERLFFPYTPYSADKTGIAYRRLPMAFIYTMNVSQERYTQDGYGNNLKIWERLATTNFGPIERYCAFNTYQFDDYSKYVADYFSEKSKAAYKQKHWEKDCQAAFDLGQRLASQVTA